MQKVLCTIKFCQSYVWGRHIEIVIHDKQGNVIRCDYTKQHVPQAPIWGAGNTTLPSRGHVGWVRRVTTEEDGSTRTKCYNPLQYDKTLRNHKRCWHCYIYETQSVCYDPVEGWWSYIGNATPHKTASVTSDLRLLHPPPPSLLQCHSSHSTRVIPDSEPEQIPQCNVKRRHSF